MNDPSQESNGLEIDPVKPQTPSEIAALLMDWMDKEKFSFQKASDIIGISRNLLSRAISGLPLPEHIQIKIANTVPGVE